MGQHTNGIGHLAIVSREGPIPVIPRQRFSSVEEAETARIKQMTPLDPIIDMRTLAYFGVDGVDERRYADDVVAAIGGLESCDGACRKCGGPRKQISAACLGGRFAHLAPRATPFCLWCEASLAEAADVDTVPK